MKKIVLSVTAALALTAAPVFAADMPVKAPLAPVAAPSPWDLAFGSALMSDYVWRGVTQSNHAPSVAAYFEPRYNVTKDVQLYIGTSGESISFSNRAAAEIDFYGGIRPTFGPVAFDFGAWYYWYPRGTCFNAITSTDADCIANADPITGGLPINGNVAKANASFYEVYAKATYTIGDWAIGVNEYYSPNFLNTGAWGDYASGTLKFTAPEKMALGPLGWYVSGEFGRQFLGTTDAFYGSIDLADYNTWNIGLGFTWKVFTLDLRYSDTDLSKADCNAFTGDYTARFSSDFSVINPGGFGSNWCGASFVAKLSADLTLGSLK
jgi:hypothetical protein